jgi:hypothetical protein
LISNIARAMITPDCKRSTTSSNCVIFVFPMEFMSPARALTSEQRAPHARPMTMRACIPLAVAGHHSPVVPDHPHPT